MQKTNRTLVVTLLAAAVSLAATAVPAQTLRMNSQWPKSAVAGQVDQWFADEVEARTDGAVKIEIFWSEGLGKAGETLSLLQNDAIDMASLSASYFPAELPLFTAPNSFPMAMNNPCEASRLMQRLVKEVPAYMEEANANGIRPLFFHVLNPYLLVSKEPITSVADMQGVKMRTWGSHMPRMVEAVGGVPVSMGMPSIYEAMSRGTIDAAPFAVDLVVNYNIYEVADHVSEITLWEGPTAAVWITDDAWAKLDEEEREVIQSVAAEARQRDLDRVLAAANEARERLEAKGMTFHEFPEAEVRKWEAALPDFFDEWVTKMEDKGKGDAAREAVRIWRDVVGSVECPSAG